MAVVDTRNTLQSHILALKAGERVFENAFEGVSRMILDSDIEKVVVNGKTTYDFKIFRTGKKHIIGMYEEINSFVSYVKDAADVTCPSCKASCCDGDFITCV